jgi:hypothetical protein
VFLALGTQREMPMGRVVTYRPHGSTKAFRIIIIIIIIIIIVVVVTIIIVVVVVVTIIYCN